MTTPCRCETGRVRIGFWIAPIASDTPDFFPLENPKKTRWKPHIFQWKLQLVGAFPIFGRGKQSLVLGHLGFIPSSVRFICQSNRDALKIVRAAQQSTTPTKTNCSKGFCCSDAGRRIQMDLAFYQHYQKASTAPPQTRQVKLLGWSWS